MWTRGGSSTSQQPSAPPLHPSNGPSLTPALYPMTVSGLPVTIPDASAFPRDDAELYMPPQRVMAPTGGRQSIRYRNYAPQQHTTKLFYVDNKLSDIDTYNEEANHSNFRTTVIHNQDLDPETAATETIQLDNRSCWGGELRTSVKTNCPNVSGFFQSDTVRVRLMSKRNPPTPPGTPSPPTKPEPYNPAGAEYKWYDIKIPEGNYSLQEIIDLLNDGVVQAYLSEGRQNNVLKSDIGVKFDTRYMNLLQDPVTKLVTPGFYVNKGFHPDIFLLPGCAVDFTYTRLSLILGIGKRDPYTKGFVITYEDLVGGNIPALLDTKNVSHDSVVADQAKPVYADKDGVSYNVMPGEDGKPVTAYRSWLLAYNQPDSVARSQYLLTVPDLSGGIGAMYTSMPDTFMAPTGFKEDYANNLSPVVGMNLFPTVSKSIYVGASSYVQRLENFTMSATAAFNRFPDNEILKQAPPCNVTSLCDNQPAVLQQGTLPVKTSLSGLQRVLITDDQRRPIPYIYKTIATVQPRVLGSATLQ